MRERIKSTLPYAMTAIVCVMYCVLCYVIVGFNHQRKAEIKELSGDIKAVKENIILLQDYTKTELDRIKAEMDKLAENGKTYTEQIDGLNNNFDRLQKDIETQIKEINERIDEVEQARIEKEAAEENQAVITASYTPEYTAPTSGLTPSGGINNFNGHTESYYNLPMDGVIQQARNFGIEGEYWVRDDGVKMYGDYVICACNRDIYPLGSLVETSFGTGISLDTGSFVAWNPTNVDIGVSW